MEQTKAAVPGHVVDISGASTLAPGEAERLTGLRALAERALERAGPGEAERLTGLRALAERALERAGRRSLPESQVRVSDYDLSQAPLPIQGLATTVEALSPEDVRAEHLRHWPAMVIGDNDEGLRTARNRLVGYAAGLALGVTKLEAEPVTDVIKAAVAMGIDLAQRQAAHLRAERQGRNAAAKRDLALQKKRKAQKQARKKNR